MAARDKPCALSTDHDDVRVEIDCPETTEITPAAATDGGQDDRE